MVLNGGEIYTFINTLNYKGVFLWKNMDLFIFGTIKNIKTHSDDTKKFLSDINTGKKLSKENIEKRVATRKQNGLKPSDETRKKISESVKAAHLKRKLSV